MKVMRICGGLGNAMFQYATYLLLKHLYPNDDIWIDTIFYDYIEYPCHIKKVFRNLNLESIDIYSKYVENNGSMQECFEPLRFWKKYGYSSFSDMEKNIKMGNLSFEELPKLYDDLPQDIRIISGGNRSIKDLLSSLNVGEKECKYNGEHDSLKREFYSFLCRKIFKDNSNTAYVCLMKMLDKSARENLFWDLVRFKRPDFRSSLKRNRLYVEGNVYFNIYGDPEDIYGIKDEVVNSFRFPKIEESDKNNYECLKIIQSSESVAIHARVVDFDYGMSSIVDRHYYAKALNYIRKKRGNNLVIIIFSDNIEWCKKHIDILGVSQKDKIIFADWNFGDDTYKDMQLMSMCKNIVIPNSTFSWWAGFLNQNPNKIMITPYGTLPGTISL